MDTVELIEIVKAAKAGDSTAIEKLYKEHYVDIFYTCKKYSISDEEAEDVTQETFIKAFDSLGELNKEENFKGWIRRIASNKCLNIIKHNKILAIDSIDEDENDSVELPSKEKTTEEMIIEKEVSDIVGQMIERLPDAQRLTIFMYYYQDMSVSEIAQYFDCPERTVRSRLDYARKAMRKDAENLENQGIKLRVLAVLPFLYVVFGAQRDALACTMTIPPMKYAASVVGNVAASVVGELAGEAANAGGVANAGATAIGAAAKSGVATAGAAVGKTIGAGKLAAIIGGSVATLAAAITAGVMTYGHFEKNKPEDNSTSNVEEDVNKHGNDKSHNNSNNDKEIDAEDTIKEPELDKETSDKYYKARIAVYQEYFDKYDQDSRYETKATLSFDENKLPIMWISLKDANTSGSDTRMTFQLVGCDDEQGKVKVLAQSREYRCDSYNTYITDGIPLLVTWAESGDEVTLIYDADKNKLVERNNNNEVGEGQVRETKYEYLRDLGNKLGWDDEEFSKRGEELIKTCCTRILYYYDSDNREIVYVGTSENYAYDVLKALDVLESETGKSSGIDINGRPAENPEGIYMLADTNLIDNKDARRLFKDAFVIDSFPASWEEEVEVIKKNTSLSKEEFYAVYKEATGEEPTDEDYKEIQKLKESIDELGIGYYNYNYNINLANGETKSKLTEAEREELGYNQLAMFTNTCFSSRSGLKFTAILNELSNKPVYTVGEMCCIMGKSENDSLGEYSEEGVKQYIKKKKKEAEINKIVEKYESAINIHLDKSLKSKYVFDDFDKDKEPDLIVLSYYEDESIVESLNVFQMVDGEIEIPVSIYRGAIYYGGWMMESMMEFLTFQKTYKGKTVVWAQQEENFADGSYTYRVDSKEVTEKEFDEAIKEISGCEQIKYESICYNSVKEAYMAYLGNNK